MDSKDDFKQVLKKFEEAQKLERKIGNKSIVLHDEKWEVLDALYRSLREYKKDFIKAMGEKNNE